MQENHRVAFRETLPLEYKMIIKETLIFFAHFHLDIGLIGIDEFEERIRIALWLSDEIDNDPRLFDTEIDPEKERKSDPSVLVEESKLNNVSDKNENNTLAFVALNTWYFTGSDPDSYPSVPHGHFQNANNTWPKLNPYTGRVFSRKNTEDNSQRLNKKNMQTLWGDVAFRNFCRSHIMWYMQAHKHYKFPVKYPYRFPRW